VITEFENQNPLGDHGLNVQPRLAVTLFLQKVGTGYFLRRGCSMRRKESGTFLQSGHA
jgi:hypothetical protein